MNLALFDFDGTITTQDTYTKFIFYTTPKWRLCVGLLLIWPIIVSYKLGWFPASKTRPILSKVAFWKRSVEDVHRSAQAYVSEFLPTVMRQEMLDKIRWHQQQGDDVFLVSASLNPYLDLWCKVQKIQLICSCLEVKNGRFTGDYLEGDCSLERKVSLLKNQVEWSDYESVYAYGDTDEDIPMLSIANYAFYQGKPFYKN